MHDLPYNFACIILTYLDTVSTEHYHLLEQIEQVSLFTTTNVILSTNVILITFSGVIEHLRSRKCNKGVHLSHFRKNLRIDF